MNEQVSDTPGKFIKRIEDAWNARDPAAYAAEFTQDATNIFFFGKMVKGDVNIADMHAFAFSVTPAEKNIALEIIEQRQLADDVCVVVTAGGVGEGTPVLLDKIQTNVLVRTNGVWRCAAFQNTQMDQETVDLYNA